MGPDITNLNINAQVLINELNKAAEDTTKSGKLRLTEGTYSGHTVKYLHDKEDDTGVTRNLNTSELVNVLKKAFERSTSLDERAALATAIEKFAAKRKGNRFTTSRVTTLAKDLKVKVKEQQAALDNAKFKLAQIKEQILSDKGTKDSKIVDFEQFRNDILNQPNTYTDRIKLNKMIKFFSDENDIKKKFDPLAKANQKLAKLEKTIDDDEREKFELFKKDLLSNPSIYYSKEKLSEYFRSWKQ